jgi:class 3 adenylate cyclase
VKKKNYGDIDPEHLKPELSTKLYRTTYSFIKQHYSEQVFDEVCATLHMPKAYLLDDDNWVSVSFGRKFAALIKNKTADPLVYRKIGHYFFDPNNINPIEFQVLRSVSPIGFFKIVSKLYSRTNLACELSTQMHGLGKYEIAIRCKQGTIYSDMFMNTLGVFEGLAKFYKLKNFKIITSDDLENIKEVSSFCFQVEYSFTQYLISKLLFLFLLIGYSAGFGLFLINLENQVGLYFLPVFIAATFLMTFLCYSFASKLSRMKENVTDYHEKSRERNFQLYQKTELLDRRLREINILKQLSEQLVHIKNPQEIVNICLDEIQRNFNYHKAAIFLVSPERKKLFLSQSRGLEKVSPIIGQLEFEYPNPHTRDGFFAHVLESGQSAFILDVEEYKKILREENRKILEVLNVGSLIIAPIQVDGNKYGVLTVFRETQEDVLDAQDRSLVENICNLFALYFDSASNFQKEINLRKIFQKYVPKPVLEHLSPENTNSTLQPTKKNICSFFVDLRNFTSLSESLTAEKVFELVSEYSKFITSHLSEEGAIIDNIIGDAVVAFTVSRTDDLIDHKMKILRAVVNIIKSWDTLINRINQIGIKKIEFGIGIHEGEATIGSVGSDYRMNYTALGDTVNTASRIQGLTKLEKIPVLNTGISVAISADFFKDLPIVVKSQPTRLRGKEDYMNIVFLDNELLLQIELFLKPQALAA